MSASAPAFRRVRRSLGLALPLLAGLAVSVWLYRISPGPAFALIVLVATLPALAYLTWHAHPAVLLSTAVVLSIFSGNWAHLGFPELIAPDRLLLAAGIATVVLRAPPIRDRGPIETKPIHWLLAATLAYVAVSALAADTLLDREAMLRLVDRIGAVPFLLFALAPVIFSTARHRTMLLACLVGVGLYLALTAFFEVAGATALVFPRYIADPSVGIHFGRARGPFVEAVGNGTALFTGFVASVIAAVTWQARWQRNIAILTAGLCIPALVFTLTRSVWAGAIIAIVVAIVAHPALRRWLVPAVVAGGLVSAVSVATVPGLADRVSERESQQETVLDRINLSRAALNMVEARPLVGFGWNRFRDVGTDYFEQGDYPLTAGVGTVVHSAYLSNLAELGLVGTTLWLLGLLLAVWIAFRRRGPPDIEPWRHGLLAITVMYLVVSAFVYPYLFATVVLWTWAGIVYGAGSPLSRPAVHPLGGQAVISRR